MRKHLFKLVAIVIAVLMLSSAIACSAVNNNPLIGKVGDVKIYYSMYSSNLSNYYYALQQGQMDGKTVHALIKNQLINYGVTLNRVHELGLEDKLTDEDRAEIQEKIQESLDSAISGYKVDESITDEDAIYEAKLEQFKAALKKNGSSFKKYMDDLEKDVTEGHLLDMLRKIEDDTITLSDDDAYKYFEDQYEKDKEAYDIEHIDEFYTAYNKYLTDSGIIPFSIPDGVFLVNHLLVKYTTQDETSGSGSSAKTEHPKVPDGGLDGEYGVFDKDAKEKIDEVITALDSGTLTVEEFQKLIDELGEDEGVQSEITEGEDKRDAGLYHDTGYVMHEELISKYTDGFGYAAMKAHDGKDWEPKKEEDKDDKDKDSDKSTDDKDTGKDSDKDSEEEEAKDYKLVYYTIKDADGQDKTVVKVETNYGVHFVFVNEDLASGKITFERSDDDKIWSNIKEYRLKELQDNHYNDAVKEWTADTKINMRDKYIDQIGVALGIIS